MPTLLSSSKYVSRRSPLRRGDLHAHAKTNRPSSAVRPRLTALSTTASTALQYQFVELAAAVESNPTELLSTLRIGADALDSQETAATLRLLQEGQHRTLAEDFLELVAKYQACPKVIETALALLDDRMEDAASTMMRTALKSHAGKK